MEKQTRTAKGMPIVTCVSEYTSDTITDRKKYKAKNTRLSRKYKKAMKVKPLKEVVTDLLGNCPTEEEIERIQTYGYMKSSILEYLVKFFSSTINQCEEFKDLRYAKLSHRELLKTILDFALKQHDISCRTEKKRATKLLKDMGLFQELKNVSGNMRDLNKYKDIDV